MKRSLAVILVLLLCAACFPALADTSYTFGDLTVTFPDGLYIMTQENHDMAALGLDYPQETIDQAFASQPGFLLDAHQKDPMFDITVFFVDVGDVPNVSGADAEWMESARQELIAAYKNMVTTSEEIKIVEHPQTKFFLAVGTYDSNGTTGYIRQYYTVEGGIGITIKLETYGYEPTEEMAALLDQVVMTSTFASLSAK